MIDSTVERIFLQVPLSLNNNERVVILPRMTYPTRRLRSEQAWMAPRFTVLLDTPTVKVARENIQILRHPDPTFCLESLPWMQTHRPGNRFDYFFITHH